MKLFIPKIKIESRSSLRCRAAIIITDRLHEDPILRSEVAALLNIPEAFLDFRQTTKVPNYHELDEDYHISPPEEEKEEQEHTEI